MKDAEIKKGSGSSKIKTFSLLLYFLLILAGLYIFHGRALGLHLRHTRVAEGNISQAVHVMWSRGFSGYVDILKGDASAGRIRPVHWLYHSTPFFLTMLRNGDFRHVDPLTNRSDRINGDLHTHTCFLLISMAIAIALIGWMGTRISQCLWFAILFPLLFLAGPIYLNENLLVNYCDSGEIAQILFISAYLFSISDIFKLKKPPAGWEIAGTLFLVLAYGMKETTMVLSAIIVGFLLWKIIAVNKSLSSHFRSFACRHIAIHSILGLALLFAVYIYKSGSYVAQNYGTTSFIARNLSRSWQNLTIYTHFIQYIIVAGFGLLFCSLFLYRKDRTAVDYNSGTLNLFLVTFGIMVGFWVVNIPWGVQLAKYYLPAFLFASLCCAVICIESARLLKRARLKPAAILWFCGSVVFLLQDIGVARDASRRFYRNNYEYRKTIPRAVKDMASMGAEKGILRVQLVAGKLFQEGELPFCRMLNRDFSKNIACNGRVVSHIKACEKNYFRINPDAQAYEIDLSCRMPESLDADLVYIWNGVSENEKEQMQRNGYEFLREWSEGSPGMRVGIYVKQ